MSSRAAIIEDLRAHLAKVAPMRETPPPTPTGIAALDAHIGGWPQPGIAHIHGAIGSGRMGLVLPAMQAHTQAGRTVAVVDPWAGCTPGSAQRGPAALDVGSVWKHPGRVGHHSAGRQRRPADDRPPGSSPTVSGCRATSEGDGERPEHCRRAHRVTRPSPERPGSSAMHGWRRGSYRAWRKRQRGALTPSWALSR